MKCALCGYEFNSAESFSRCQACPLTRHCHLVCCPNCGYQVPDRAHSLSWFKRIKQKFNPEKTGPIPPHNNAEKDEAKIDGETVN